MRYLFKIPAKFYENTLQIDSVVSNIPGMYAQPSHTTGAGGYYMLLAAGIKAMPLRGCSFTLFTPKP